VQVGGVPGVPGIILADALGVSMGAPANTNAAAIAIIASIVFWFSIGYSNRKQKIKTILEILAIFYLLLDIYAKTAPIQGISLTMPLYEA
jgi:hypothetical protein